MSHGSRPPIPVEDLVQHMPCDREIQCREEVDERENVGRCGRGSHDTWDAKDALSLRASSGRGGGRPCQAPIKPASGSALRQMAISSTTTLLLRMRSAKYFCLRVKELYAELRLCMVPVARSIRPCKPSTRYSPEASTT